ncbi:hypothetical protein F5Y07DRAFT_202135, partial [Xylaria sp. FL0933]
LVLPRLVLLLGLQSLRTAPFLYHVDLSQYAPQVSHEQPGSVVKHNVETVVLTGLRSRPLSLVGPMAMLDTRHKSGS